MSLGMKIAKQGPASPMIAAAMMRSRLGSRIGGVTPGFTTMPFNPVYSRARAGQQGDFGSILSGIGKAVSFIPGVGSIIGTGMQALGGAITKKPKVSAPQIAPTGPGLGGPSLGTLGQMPQLGGSPLMTVGSGGGSGGSVAVVKSAAGASCGVPGYHLNKSGYWRNESKLLPGASWVEPGTVCVRNRKRNPFNPKAASRAMSRLSALSCGMRSLEKQMAKLGRQASRGRTRAPSFGGKTKRCGCK